MTLQIYAEVPYSKKRLINTVPRVYTLDDFADERCGAIQPQRAIIETYMPDGLSMSAKLPYFKLHHMAGFLTNILEHGQQDH